MIKVFNAYIGTEIKVDTFSLFASICKYVAEKLLTLEEHKDYPEHQWGSVWFMTDRFGGNYASFHFDATTAEVTYMKGYPQEERVTSLERLVDLVKADKKRMERARDLYAVAEAINREY